MKPPIETVRLSQQSRDALIKLKRKTGIEHWNTLSRWGFCFSLGTPLKFVNRLEMPESNVEMSWRVFAGPLAETLPALLIVCAQRDRIANERDPLANYFRGHLERGISQIQNVTSLSALLGLVSKSTENENLDVKALTANM